MVETTNSPAEILAGLNRRLKERGTGFTTCLAIRISSAGSLVISNAGHLAPYLNGKELVTSPAFPLGLDPNGTFAEQTFPFEPGDWQTVLTDGVPEATSQREPFGFDRTANLSSSDANAIANAALQFGQSDDITVISSEGLHHCPRS